MHYVIGDVHGCFDEMMNLVLLFFLKDSSFLEWYFSFFWYLCVSFQRTSIRCILAFSNTALVAQQVWEYL